MSNFVEFVATRLESGAPVSAVLREWIGDEGEQSFEAEQSDALHKTLVGVVDFLDEKIKVFTVNGQFVRNPDGGGIVAFTMGANYYAGDPPGLYRSICGEDEIVLHDLLSPVDFMATLVHELAERYVMKNQGLDYDTAHSEYAEPLEIAARRILESEEWDG